MLKTGWIRLWIVLTCLVLLAAIVMSSFYVWGREVCYRFISVTIADTASTDDKQLAKGIREEATTKTFTGKYSYSPLLTLEGLAKRGAVTQVGVEWLEPDGWSFKDHDYLDVFENKGPERRFVGAPEITTSEIISRVSGHVYSARLRKAAWFVSYAFGVCAAVLAFGDWNSLGTQRICTP